MDAAATLEAESIGEVTIGEVTIASTSVSTFLSVELTSLSVALTSLSVALTSLSVALAGAGERSLGREIRSTLGPCSKVGMAGSSGVRGTRNFSGTYPRSPLRLAARIHPPGARVETNLNLAFMGTASISLGEEGSASEGSEEAAALPVVVGGEDGVALRLASEEGFGGCEARDCASESRSGGWSRSRWVMASLDLAVSVGVGVGGTAREDCSGEGAVSALAASCGCSVGSVVATAAASMPDFRVMSDLVDARRFFSACAGRLGEDREPLRLRLGESVFFL